jgi:hypothetical protein
MKHRKFVVWVFCLLCAAALFLGCKTEPDEEDDGGLFIEGFTVEAGQTMYYSLSTGQAVEANKANTTDWDIAFTRTRLVLTNSGYTATEKGSSGAGGVWYAGTTNFGNVTLANRGADNAPYSTDTDLYVWTGMGQAPTAKTPLNVMTYVGYGYGNGSSNAFGEWTPSNAPTTTPHDYTGYPYNGPLTVYKYNANQYYNSTSMYDYPPTNKVYIIRHADGTHYSKIQIVYEYIPAVMDGNTITTPAKDAFQIKYKNLN